MSILGTMESIKPIIATGIAQRTFYIFSLKLSKDRPGHLLSNMLKTDQSLFTLLFRPGRDLLFRTKVILSFFVQFSCRQVKSTVWQLDSSCQHRGRGFTKVSRDIFSKNFEPHFAALPVFKVFRTLFLEKL